MSTQKLQARPSAAVASAAAAALDVIDDADQGAARPLFSSASPAAGAGGAAALEETPYVSSAFPSPFAVASQTADAAAVRPLAGASSEPALSGNGFTYRHNWGLRRGQWTLRLNIGGATARSRVMVSIGEGAAGGPDAGKFIGAARFTVHNVAPRAGGVDVWVNVEWGADIPLYIDYLIVNP